MKETTTVQGRSQQTPASEVTSVSKIIVGLIGIVFVCWFGSVISLAIRPNKTPNSGGSLWSASDKEAIKFLGNGPSNSIDHNEGSNVIGGRHIYWRIESYLLGGIWTRYRATATDLTNITDSSRRHELSQATKQDKRSDAVVGTAQAFKDPTAALEQSIKDMFARLFQKGIMEAPSSSDARSFISASQIPIVNLPIIEY